MAMELFIKHAFVLESLYASHKILRFRKGDELVIIQNEILNNINRGTDVSNITISSKIMVNKKGELVKDVLVTIPNQTEFCDEVYSNVWNDTEDVRLTKEWGIEIAEGVVGVVDHEKWWNDNKPNLEIDNIQQTFKEWMTAHSEFTSCLGKKAKNDEIELELYFKPLVKKYMNEIRMKSDYIDSQKQLQKELKEDDMIKTIEIHVPRIKPKYYEDVKNIHEGFNGGVEILDWNDYYSKQYKFIIADVMKMVEYLKNKSKEIDNEFNVALLTKEATEEEYYIKVIDQKNRRIEFNQFLDHVQFQLDTALGKNKKYQEEYNQSIQNVKKAVRDLEILKQALIELSASSDKEEEYANKRVRLDNPESIDWKKLMIIMARKYFRNWIQRKYIGIDGIISDWFKLVVEEASPEYFIIGSIEMDDTDVAELIVKMNALVAEMSQFSKDVTEVIKLDDSVIWKKRVLKEFTFKAYYFIDSINELIGNPLVTKDQSKVLTRWKTRVNNLLKQMKSVSLDDLLEDDLEIKTMIKKKKSLYNLTKNEFELAIEKLRHVNTQFHTSPLKPFVQGSVKTMVAQINNGAFAPSYY
jgi:hypothetical protein